MWRVWCLMSCSYRLRDTLNLHPKRNLWHTYKERLFLCRPSCQFEPQQRVYMPKIEKSQPNNYRALWVFPHQQTITASSFSLSPFHISGMNFRRTSLPSGWVSRSPVGCWAEATCPPHLFESSSGLASSPQIISSKSKFSKSTNKIKLTCLDLQNSLIWSVPSCKL